MTINKLELPDWKQSPMVDWSPLGKIGDAIRDRQRQERIRDAVEGARGADGHVSLARLGETLTAAGEVDPGIRALYLGGRQDAQSQQAVARQAFLDQQAAARGQRPANQPSNVRRSAAAAPATMPPPDRADRWPLPAGYTGAPAVREVRDAMRVGVDDPNIVGRLRAYGIDPSELRASGDASTAGAGNPGNNPAVKPDAPPARFNQRFGAWRMMSGVDGLPGSAVIAPQAMPPLAGARLAPDGRWYVPDPTRPGQYLMLGQ